MKVNQSPVHLKMVSPSKLPSLHGNQVMDLSPSRPMSPEEQFGLMGVEEGAEPTTEDLEVL